MPAKKKPIPRGELSKLKMVSGNEKKYLTAIDDGEVKEWVGIGWVTLRPATADDLKKFPLVEPYRKD